MVGPDEVKHAQTQDLEERGGPNPPRLEWHGELRPAYVERLKDVIMWKNRWGQGIIHVNEESEDGSDSPKRLPNREEDWCQDQITQADDAGAEEDGHAVITWGAQKATRSDSATRAHTNLVRRAKLTKPSLGPNPSSTVLPWASPQPQPTKP